MTKINRYFIQTKLYLIIVSVLIATGCTIAPVKNISSNTQLYEDEGILITKIRTNISNSFIYVHGKGETWPWAKFDPVKAPEDLRVIKIKSGESHFSKFYRGNSFVWDPGNYFVIEPGTITYVGDLVVEWSAEREGPAAYILLIDRESETVAEAREKYPWIFERYPYRKYSIKECKE